MPEQEIRSLLDGRRRDQAFELIVGEYQGKVFGLAYSILGNRGEAEDAAQESVLRVRREMTPLEAIAEPSAVSHGRRTCIAHARCWALG